MPAVLVLEKFWSSHAQWLLTAGVGQQSGKDLHSSVQEMKLHLFIVTLLVGLQGNVMVEPLLDGELMLTEHDIHHNLMLPFIVH